ncbi:MAG: polyprenyl synthetase family protein [Phycisphaerae bacterium]|nr:polyprenyl synthetase family protein [Phycisphaerae bacterium]
MAEKTEKIDIKIELEQKASLVNEVIAAVIKGFVGIPDRLREAIEYTLSAPGKRVRAAVVLLCCESVAGNINKDAEIAAAAIEMVHTYSLVHDDLPAMDDDDFRRGKPSCHKAFDEATAILTGDALLTMAFELLSTKISEPSKAVEMIKTLAEAAGPAGMIAGQVDDLLAQNGTGSSDNLHNIHINKTAKMFAASALLGAIAGGASRQQKDLLGRFGLKLGLGFQIADDILDVSSTSTQLGKTAGKDAEQGKLTYPAVFGLEQSRKKADELANQAAEILEPFEEKANMLKGLVLALLNRTK